MFNEKATKTWNIKDMTVNSYKIDAENDSFWLNEVFEFTLQNETPCGLIPTSREEHKRILKVFDRGEEMQYQPITVLAEIFRARTHD